MISKKDKLEFGILICLAVTIILLYISPINFLFVSGHSMEPTISDGDVVVTVPVDYEQLEEGDIIAFRHDEQNIIHRIIDFEDGMIRTKGDNVSKKDPFLITSSEVVGKYVLKIPNLGLVLRKANSAGGYVLLILIPAILLIYYELKNIWKERTVKNNQR